MGSITFPEGLIPQPKLLGEWPQNVFYSSKSNLEISNTKFLIFHCSGLFSTFLFPLCLIT